MLALYSLLYLQMCPQQRRAWSMIGLFTTKLKTTLKTYVRQGIMESSEEREHYCSESIQPTTECRCKVDRFLFSIFHSSFRIGRKDVMAFCQRVDMRNGKLKWRRGIWKSVGIALRELFPEYNRVRSGILRHKKYGVTSIWRRRIHDGNKTSQRPISIKSSINLREFHRRQFFVTRIVR